MSIVNKIDISPVIKHYFNPSGEDEVLASYVQLGIEALKNGEVCVQVEKKDEKVLLSSNQVSSTPDDLTKPFIFTSGKFYFQRYLSYENQVLFKIEELIKSGENEAESRLTQLRNHKELINQLFGGFKVVEELSEKENIDWQRVAVVNAFLKNFMVLTGGPGTGKTTTVSKLLVLLFSQNPALRVSLIAQTGKASARLHESLDNSRKDLSLTSEVASAFDKIKPSTIHRFLEYIKDSIDFKRNKQNLVESDVVILDESSMVDLPMMAKLLNAIPVGARVYLLGDLNQLSSVEVGSVFGDLCLSLGNQVNLLTTLQEKIIHEFYPAYRQAGSKFVNESNSIRDSKGSDDYLDTKKSTLSRYSEVPDSVESRDKTADEKETLRSALSDGKLHDIEKSKMKAPLKHESTQLSMFGDNLSRHSEEGTTEESRHKTTIKKENLPLRNVKETKNILQDHVIKLERSYRFSSVKGLGKFAYSLLSGEEISDSFLKEYKREIKVEEGVRVVSTPDTEVEKQFISQYTYFIEELDILTALELMNKVKVLCAVKEGSRGVFEMNKKIESLLESKGLIEPSALNYHNQPILILKNDYTVGLYNGDVGLIRKNESGRLMAYFRNSSSSRHSENSVESRDKTADEKETLRSALSDETIRHSEGGTTEESKNELVSYDISSLPIHQTAFAMTIHKSQGSEFEDVFLVLPEKEHKVLSKQLVYTGVTRAKKRVLILASDEVFMSSVQKVEQRLSNLKDRF